MGKLGRVVLGVLLQIGIVGGDPCAAQDAAGNSPLSVESGTGPTVTLRVYNYAQISGGHLTGGEKEASRIFRHAGLEIRWENYSPAAKGGRLAATCRGGCPPTDLFVSILTPKMWVEMPHHDPLALGFATVPEEGARSSRAYISWDDINDLSRARGIVPEEDNLLGCVMAHEIGHLLLRTTQHTVTGIMRGHWGQNQLRLATQSALDFSKAQGSTLRAEVAARAKTSAASTAALRGPK